MTEEELKGKQFISKSPFELRFLIHYAAPYTGAGSMIAPEGVVITISNYLRKETFACDLQDENFVEQVHKEAKKESEGNDLLDGKYSGFSPHITKSEFFAHFEEVKK